MPTHALETDPKTIRNFKKVNF